MKPLPHPDNKHLEAAEGWLELGNYLEENEELGKKNHPTTQSPSLRPGNAVQDL